MGSHSRMRWNRPGRKRSPRRHSWRSSPPGPGCARAITCPHLAARPASALPFSPTAGFVFGLYHPTAAQVYLVGDFNDWQSPGHGQPDPGQFIPLRLYRGLGGLPNTWLTVTDRAHAGDSYRFFVVGGVPRDDQGREFRNSIDPYSRRLNADFTRNDSVVVDAAGFAWTDDGWRTPDPAGLVLYELSVAGFTQGDPDIDPG